MSKNSEKRLKSLREGARVRKTTGPHWHRIQGWLNDPKHHDLITFGAREDLETIVTKAYDDGVHFGQDDEWVENRFKWYRERVVTLEAALRELLEDTQHLEHECSDDDCLVTKARRALTQTEETPDENT